MSEAPKVSAILVNWNGAHHLRICLPSLRAQSFTSLEIIVVDNGSSDDSVEIARDFEARWLSLGANVGLAPALNRGAEIARGDYLLFINNDMRFDPGFVAALVQGLESGTDIFAADAMQFNWEGTAREHLAATLTRSKPSGQPSVELVPGLHFFQAPSDSQTPVFMGSAACMLVRRSLFERLNGFDNRLPLGYEDAEICWRAWLRGWQTVFVPGALCWHRVGASGRSKEGARLNFRGILTGRLLVATKLLPPQYMIRTWLAAVAGLGKDLIRLKWRSAGDRISILGHCLGISPQLLREKAMLFQSAGRTAREHLNFLLQLTS